MKRVTKNILVTLVIVVGFTFLTMLRGGTGINLDFGDDSLTITGPKQYACTVAYKDVASLELVTLADPGEPVTGSETRTYRWGTWSNDAWGNYELCMVKKADRCILLTRTDGSLLILNYTDNATTEELCKMFTNLLAHYAEGSAQTS